MAKQQGGGGDKGDFESTLVVTAVASVILALMAWWMFGDRLSSFFGVIRRYELIPFAHFFEHAASQQALLAQLNGGPLDFHNTLGMLDATGRYVRFLYLPPLPFLTYYLFKKSTRLRYQRKHTMVSLMKDQAVLWPEIAPIVGKQDLLMNGDLDHDGEWAVALTEWEFAEKHGLANRQDKKVDEDKARKVFGAQLGPRWTSFKSLPPHRKALYAALLLRIAEQKSAKEKDRELADYMAYLGGTGSKPVMEDACIAKLRLMSKSFADHGLKGMDVSWADEVFAKYGQHPNLLRVHSQHAYVYTVLATMLQLSRSDGILHSPMFIWLKTVDRGLWYMLNNVGRYAFHVECAGVAAHWLWEKTVSMPCPTPMVDKAVQGLQIGLLEYTEDDSLDRLYK
jgi:intracellular multiplication protein IcmP